MKYKLSILLFLAFIIFSCRDYTPRPVGYNRIDLPERNIKEFVFPEFSFSYPDYIRIDTLKSSAKNEYWFNIVYPQNGAVIHLTYIRVNKNTVNKAIDDSYHLAYSHAIKAENIEQIAYKNEKAHVSGIFYDIQGDVATPAQFFLTDSLNHFVRGSFYFSTTVDMDSIEPVTERVKEDLKAMIGSFRWYSSLR